jgi:hypothetical protein
MDHDCGFDEDGRWFRYRAAAIILHAGTVLMAHLLRDRTGPARQSAEVDHDPGLRSASVAAS